MATDINVPILLGVQYNRTPVIASADCFVAEPDLAPVDWKECVDLALRCTKIKVQKQIDQPDKFSSATRIDVLKNCHGMTGILYELLPLTRK